MSWISGTKPKLYKNVLVTTRNYDVLVCDFEGEEWVSCDGQVYELDEIIAWQPLPEPYMGENMLTCKEKNYLSAVLKPFNVKYIRKDKLSDETREFLTVGMIDTSFLVFPFFPTGKYYKGLENGRKYTRAELFDS